MSVLESEPSMSSRIELEHIHEASWQSERKPRLRKPEDRKPAQMPERIRLQVVQGFA